MRARELADLLEAEVSPVCIRDEISAVALAAAYANQVLDGNIDKMELTVSAAMYSNDIEQAEMSMAAALGAIKKDPQKQLAILESVTAEELVKAGELVRNGVIHTVLDREKSGVWIQVRIESGIHWCQAIIKDKYINLLRLEKDNRTIFMDNQLINEGKREI